MSPRGYAVAEEKDLAKKIGLTRAKLVLIGILAVVLVGVVYIQFGPDGSEGGAVTAVNSTPEAAAPQPAPPARRTTSAAAQSAPAIAAAAGPPEDANEAADHA